MLITNGGDMENLPLGTSDAIQRLQLFSAVE